MKDKPNYTRLTFLTLLLHLFSCGTIEMNESVVADQSSIDTVAGQVEEVQLKQIGVIDAPFDSCEIPLTEFKMEKNKKTTIELASGTEIEIPKGCFEDQNGNPVEENITIAYREFHSVAEIMASGINMTYDGGDFESAGMFEIRAFAKDEELKLRKDKTISIKLASFKEGDFDAFYMDETTSNWQILPKNRIERNRKKAEKLAKLDTEEDSLGNVCKDEPQPYNPKENFIDLNYDFTNYPELELFHGAQWELVGDSADNKGFDSDHLTYTEMEINRTDECGVFELSLWKKGRVPILDETKSYRIAPVWGGKALDRAKKNFKTRMVDFRAQQKQIQVERKIARQEADLLRNFEISKMGIFNCDRKIDFLKAILVGISLKCVKKIHSWWYITQGKQIAIKYYSPKNEAFNLNIASENSIIAVLEDGEIATFNEAEFRHALSTYDSHLGTEFPLELELKTDGQKRIEKLETLELAIQEL